MAKIKLKIRLNICEKYDIDLYSKTWHDYIYYGNLDEYKWNKKQLWKLTKNKHNIYRDPQT